MKVLTLTPELLSKKRFAPVKNYESDVLLQGELQLSNGTVLIIDETQLPSGSFPVSGFGMCLICWLLSICLFSVNKYL